MLKISGSIGTEKDKELADSLYFLQEHKNIMSMIQEYELKQMSVTEEASFFQYLLDSGLVWVMPGAYIAKTQDLLDKNIIYFNWQPPHPVLQSAHA